MNVSSRSLKLWSVLAGLALAISSSWSYATIVGNEVGTWNVKVGNKTATGDISIDSKTGAISIDNPFAVTDDTQGGTGGTLSLTRFDGNVDPFLGFGLAGVTGANPSSFSATFSLPLSLSGLVLGKSNVSYTLTRLGTGSSTLSPFNTFTVTARDKNTSTGAQVDKGVDIGDTFTVSDPTIGDTKTFPSTTTFKENVFVAPAGMDLFTVQVAFDLTKETSGTVGGVVHQIPVPEPSTYALLAAGLAFVGFVARRRLNA